MLSSYLAIVLKELKQHPGFALVKLLSLAIGLAGCLLVLLHLRYVAGFDRHFAEAEGIYRLVSDFSNGSEEVSAMVSAAAWEPQLRLDYPQIRHSANVSAGYGQFSRDGVASDSAFAFVDPGFLEIFRLDFIRGNPDEALRRPDAIVLSQSAARRYFPGEDPMGKVLGFDDQADFEVTGVYRDLPENTHFDLPMIVPVAAGRAIYNEGFMTEERWLEFNGTVTYLRFDSAADAHQVERDLDNFLRRHQPARGPGVYDISNLRISLEPLSDFYLSERGVFQGYNPRTTVFGSNDAPRRQMLWALGLFALLILLSSGVNFASLTLAQLQERGKEIGLRKTLGAGRGQLVFRFLFEAMLLALVALLLALPLAILAIPLYTRLTDTGFTWHALPEPAMLLGALAFTLATGVLSGLLPALQLSRYRPAQIVKGRLPRTGMSLRIRFAIIVVQFTLSTSLIMMALAVVLQVRHLNTMNLGFNKNDLVVFDSSYNWFEPELFDYGALVDELAAHPDVLAVGLSNAPLPVTALGAEWRLPDSPPDEFLSVGDYIVDDDYLDALQLKLLAGRNFSADFLTDFIPQARDSYFPTPEEAGVRSVLITEATAEKFGFDTPRSALDRILVSAFGFRYRVIGVIADFHTRGGLENPALSPGILRASLDPLTYVFVRLDPRHVETGLGHIDAVWQRHRPGVAMNRSFYEQTYAELVGRRTNGIGRAATYASVVTVLIATFGIYSLAYFSGQRRTREVGIRKVLGASSASIMLLMVWDLLKPVLVALLLSWDGSARIVDRYLQQYSSQVDISPLLYLALCFATLLLVVLSTAAQTWRSANIKPVDTLQYE